MSLVEEIQTAIKSNRIIVGYKESINFVKTNSPKLIVLAKNVPKNIKKEIDRNAKISNSKIEIFDGNSSNLGIICGKPFPVSILIIKD